MLGAVVLAVLAVSCDTLNIGNGLPGRGPVVGTITVPTGLFAQNNGDFSVNWTSGQAPYTITWNFGGGANPDTIGPLAGAVSPDAQTVLFTNNAGGTFTVTVTVTDSLGQSGSGSASYTYGIVQNQAPVLSVAGGDGTNSITIHGEDTDGDDITVTAAAPAGLATGGSQTISGGSGDVTFTFTASDLFAGGNGSVDFSGVDNAASPANSNTVSANVVVAGIVLAADTLYAIPLVGSAAAGDTVTVVVASGVPANPFQFMNGCRVTAPTGFAYVSNTFNIGVPGGADAGAVDGFWTGMNPGGGFLLAPDNFIVETDLGGGLIGVDFNCTPIGGSDRTTDSGALFNFGANFGAGTNTLGFQDVSGVSRTYYTDSNAAPDRFWGDITNNHAGVPNSVDVS